MIYADIIIDISHEKLDKTFQYIVPAHLKDVVHIGSQVVIPFGKGDRAITGYVVDITDTPSFDVTKLKAIARVVTESIPIESQLITLAGWMKRHYGSTMNQALRTVIPIKKKEAAREKKKIRLLISREQAQIELNELCARKNHSVGKERLLRELIDNEVLEWDLVTKNLQISSAVIRDLEAKAIIALDFYREYRNPVAATDNYRKKVTLNDMQQSAVDKVLTDYSNQIYKTYLIHGVTGSGKTEVYMEIMDKVLAMGRQVIVLIPEIALTYQTLMRFYARFGDKVSILNSKMSPGERFDQFERAKKGEISVMIGPRSALFTPFENLGLIIIDEEHEPTYKSEVIPRYHARETAIYRAGLAKASVVLGSATPSVESYAMAENGTYELINLEKRAAGQAMAACEVVDLREELAAGNKSMLSRSLQLALKDRLEKKEQSMVFLNRRGLMGFVSCRACGSVIKCPHCDVSLHLHNDGHMRCHYCGFDTFKPTSCPDCGSKYIGTFKAGTQRLEEIIREQFPSARVLRMDADTTRGKDGHDEILASFAAGEADVLIGTQMIVKGHDFANVTLVGVIAADISLNDSDYHSGERTFQLLTQAVGRAGRGSKAGEAIIQTYQPDNYAIVASAAQDYDSFYRQEIAYRRMLHYPPAAHMLGITIASEKLEQATGQANEIKNIIDRCNTRSNVLGPADAYIGKLKDVYRKVIYVKNKDYNQLVFIKDQIEAYLLEQKQYRNTSTWFDFDPINTL
ncbi:MAG: primosomal protein N' [Pseudobutyrivibrio sp.]|nr:primosomal protein N' [Pseudobutyrivibrio sp.]